MRGIPVAHARWIGSLLNQLSDEQLRDAFRAANYSEGVRDSYVTALRERINQLTQLPNRSERRQKSESVGTKINRFNSHVFSTAGSTVSKAYTKVRSTIKRGN